jgi:hypothetical protein
MVTQHRDELGKLRGETVRKAWHTCGNPPHNAADFYPLFYHKSVREYAYQEATQPRRHTRLAERAHRDTSTITTRTGGGRNRTTPPLPSPPACAADRWRVAGAVTGAAARCSSSTDRSASSWGTHNISAKTIANVLHA